MAAIHNATMVAARRLNHGETIPQQDSASNMLNKLARTFASRSRPSRKLSRRANDQGAACAVNEGGQAIVGNVRQGVAAQQKMEANLMNPVQRLNATLPHWLPEGAEQTFALPKHFRS